MFSLKQTILSFIAAAFITIAGAASAENPIVKLETNVGDITVLLYADKAPKTVENFLAHVDEGFYKHTIFHRVIDNFMVQGGGFDVDLSRKTQVEPWSTNRKIDFIMNGARWQWRAPVTPTLRAASSLLISGITRASTGRLSNLDTRCLVRSLVACVLSTSWPRRLQGMRWAPPTRERCRYKTYPWTQSYFFASRAYPNDNS